MINTRSFSMFPLPEYMREKCWIINENINIEQQSASKIDIHRLLSWRSVSINTQSWMNMNTLANKCYKMLFYF